MKELMVKELADVKKDIEVKTKLNKSVQKLKDVEQKTEDLDVRMKVATKAIEKVKMMLQYKAMDTYLCFRGVPDKENIREEIVQLFAEFLNHEVELIDGKIDLIYTVKSFYTEKKNLPRDIIVQFITKKLKEDILTQQYKSPLRTEGKHNYNERITKEDLTGKKEILKINRQVEAVK